MSVIVKGMKMPDNCDKCRLVRYFGLAGGIECLAKEEWPVTSYADDKFREIGVRPDWCPLVELPEKHGRLLDSDALIAEYDRVHVGEPGRARKLMEDAPTIFEAEGEQ